MGWGVEGAGLKGFCGQACPPAKVEKGNGTVAGYGEKDLKDEVNCFKVFVASLRKHLYKPASSAHLITFV